MSSEAPGHHANLDFARRRLKAQKIITILGRRRDLAGLRILDIGTGSGVIAECFANAAGSQGHVDSVDVVDVRIVRDSYAYQRIDGTVLPFDDNTFDVVVSNHVVEHVGVRDRQQEHLAEIARTLRPDGIAYFAFPNRFGLFEPHFRLPLLGALPKPAQDRYVRIARHAPVYDCRLLTWSDFQDLASTAGLLVEDCTGEVMRLAGATESTNAVARLVTRVPVRALSLLRSLSPTMVAIVRPRAASAAT